MMPYMTTTLRTFFVHKMRRMLAVARVLVIGQVAAAFYLRPGARVPTPPPPPPPSPVGQAATNRVCSAVSCSAWARDGHRYRTHCAAASSSAEDSAVSRERFAGDGVGCAADKGDQGVPFTRGNFIGALGTAGAAAAVWGAVARSSDAAGLNARASREESKTCVFGQVEKSPNDPRSYRAIQLPSGMKVLLVSDPETKSAAAAMDVHVGHFSDPDDLPGLAHFCEHLLFLGTDKYPDETSYSVYLSSHGGSSNAYTSTEDTVYFFDVGSDHLGGALDRFAQFFIAPQFTEAATGRELNAIEAENAKNQISDTFRGYQLEKLRANPSHPYSKFGTGNKQTLLEEPAKKGRSARQALLRFFDTYYSANQMTLVVLGKESLPALSRMVDGLFSSVPNRGAGTNPSNRWIGRVKPFFNNQPLQAFNVVPVQDERSMTVAWPFSFENAAERKEVLETKPFTYIGSLLGHEGPGSLLSYLKRQNWATAFGVDATSTTDDFTIFEVEVQLTPEGLANRFKIIAALFGYIDLIKKSGVPSFLPSELAALSDLGWRFQDKKEPGSLVPSLAASMQEYDPEFVLSGPSRLRRYNETLVNRLLGILTPEPADYSAATPLVTVSAKDFERKATEREKWYGTRYQIENLASRAKEWGTPRTIPELKLPGPNPFVPENLSVIVPKGKVLKPGEKVSPPLLVETLQNAGVWKVRHKLDDVFAQPKAFCFFELVTPVAYESPRTVAALKLFEMSLDERLNEYTYDAQVAGLGYSLDFTTRGVRLSFGGFDDKMPEFIAKIAEAVATHAPDDPQEFERLRDVVRRELANYDTQQPYQHAMSNAGVATEKPRYTVKEIRETLDSIKMSELRPLVARVFREAEGSSLMQGNLRQEDVPRYLEGVRRWFDPAPLDADKQPERVVVQLPRTPLGCGSLIRRREENRENANSASQLVFQIPERTVESRVMAQLLMSIMEDPYYDSLRTQQQLGYLVFSGVKVVEGVSSMFLLVQSAERSPSYLTDRSLEFLQGFRRDLVDLPASKLRDYVGGLVDRKLEPDRRLSSEAERNWAEMTSGQLNFDRRREEARALGYVREGDLLRFFDRHFMEGGEERRVLASEVFASQHTSGMETPARGATFVLDEKRWRKDQEKFPVRQRLS